MHLEITLPNGDYMTQFLGVLGILAIIYAGYDVMFDDEPVKKALPKIGLGILLIIISVGAKFIGVDF